MMRKTSLTLRWTKNIASRNERNLRADGVRTRALRLESLESRELLSVAPGNDQLAIDALAVYESNGAIPADVLDLSAAVLDDSDVAPVAPEWLTVAAPVAASSPTPLETPVLTVADKTATAVTVSWDAVAHAERYSLSYKLTSASTWTNVNVGTDVSYTASGLETNTSYDFRLKAIGDGVNYKSVYSEIVSAVPADGPIPLETPVLTVAGKTPTSVTVSWDAVAHAARYSLSYKLTSASTWTNVNVGTDVSYTASGLETNTSYDFRLKAVGDDVNYKSVYSAIVSAAPADGPVPLETPVLTVADKTPTSVTVSWDAVAHAERYSLSYKLESASTWTNVNVGTNTSYTVSDLVTNKSYDFRLKAVGDGVNYKSVYSEPVSALPADGPVPLATPVLTVAGKTETTVTVSWGAVAHAVRYSLSYKLSSASTWTNVNVGTNTSYKVSDLLTNTSYDFRLKAIGDGTNYKSVYSPIIQATPDATPPSPELIPLPAPVLTVTGRTGTTISVKWTAVENAVRYSLSYKRPNADDWTTVNVGTETSYIVTELKKNLTYDLRVKAVGDEVNYKGVYSAIVKGQTDDSPTPLAKPVPTVADKTSSTITVSWAAVPHAERYSFSYKLANETTWTNKNVGTNTSYTITGLDADAEYDVRVKAVGDETTYKSVYSPILRVKTNPTITPLDPPNLTVDAAVTLVTVSWDAVENAQRYDLDYKLAGATTWTNVNVGTDASYTITELQANTEYDVRVKAVGDNDIYQSVDSEIVRVKTASTPIPLATPILTYVAAPTSLTVSWDAVARADRYSLSYKLSSETAWTNVNVGSEMSYTITGLALNTSCDLRVKAIGDGVNYKSVYSAIVPAHTLSDFLPLSTPVLTTPECGPTFITINWELVPNAERYSVFYRLAGSTAWTNKNAGTNTSYTITGLALGAEYEVRVKAIGDEITYKSSFSPIALYETTNEPIKLQTPKATVETAPNSLTVSWDAVPNAVRYGVSYRLAGETEWTNGDVGTNLSYTVEGLDPTTEYEVRVEAVGDGTTYESSYSAVISVRTTEPDWPIVTAIDVSNDSILLHWNAMQNAAGYYVAYAPVGSTTFLQKYVVAPTSYARITGLSANTEYQMKIRVVTYESTFEFSPIVTRTTSSEPFVKTALAAPTVSARGIASDALYVEWAPDPRATGYIVGYKERAEGTYKTINVPASENGLLLSGLDPDENYHVRVKTVGDNVFWSSSTYSATQTAKTKDASFLSTAEYEGLRARYDQLLLPESLADVNIVLLEDWTAGAMIDAIEAARSTSVDDVILLEPGQYSGEVLDLSGVTITLDVDYETSGAISFLSRGMDADLDRSQIKVNDSEVAFDAIAGLTQFGGIDFVDVNPEVSIYQVTASPTLEAYPTAVDMQDVGAYTSDGISIAISKNAAFTPPQPCANPSEHDYALLFIGGSNPTANHKWYYEALYDYYYELVEDFALDPAKIYILYADGDVSGESPNMNNKSAYNTSVKASDMSFVLEATTVRAAIGSELTSTLGEIANLMTTDSHLLFWTYDHGDGMPRLNDRGGLYEEATSDFDDYLCGWSQPINGKPVAEEDYKISGATVRDALFQIRQGFVTCVFTQCFSGGILDDIFDPSTGNLRSVENGYVDGYDGSAKFVGGAATNHYEVSWTGEYQGVGYVGYAQTFEEALRYRSSGVDAFDYTEKNDPFSAANPHPLSYTTYSPTYNPNEGFISPPSGFGEDKTKTEHPWHFGETFPVFTTSPEHSAPTIASHSSTDDSITLTWSAVPNASFYTLECVAVDGTNFMAVEEISTNSYTLTGLIPAKYYKLRVKANNSPYSPQTTVWTEPGGFPETPSTVVTTADDDSTKYDGKISLREALEYAEPGDTITFDSSLRGKTIKLSASLGVKKSVIIDASNLYDSITKTPGLAISVEGSKRIRIMSLNANQSLTVKGVEFTRGYSTGNSGAAILNKGGDLTVDKCVFCNNNGVAISLTSQSGSVTSASLTAASTVFSGNNGSGSVFFNTNKASSFTDCVFENNDAQRGSVYINNGAVAMTNCFVRGNRGSGLYVESNGRLTATNCLVVGNTAAIGGGLELSGKADLYYCTVAGNSANLKGGGVYLEGAVFNAYNTIIAGNTATSGENDVEIVNGSAHCRYVLTSLVTGWDTEEELHIYDPSLPLFNDAQNGDYTLVEDSQAINKGNAVVPTGATVTTDLLGKNRVSGNVPDLGAYEYQFVAAEPLDAPTNVAASSTTNSMTVTWNAVDAATRYKVEYKLTNVSAWTTWSESVATTSATITGLSQGASYSARVTARSDDPQYSDSAPSQTASAWTLEQLAIPTISAKPDVNKATVSWSAVPNASGYALSYKESSEPDVAASWTVVGDISASATSYTVASLDGAREYDFKLVAKGNGTRYADSDPSLVVTALVKAKLPTPANFTVDTSVPYKATVSWDAVANASGYRVSYRKSGESTWSYLNLSETQTSFTINNLEGATEYDFRVVAKGDQTWYVNSNASPVARERILRKLDAPTIVNTDSDLDTITVSWNAVENAAKYRVRYASSGTNAWSSWQTVANATSWSTQVDLPSIVRNVGAPYVVQIVAIATGGDVNSDAATTTVETEYLAVPTVIDKSAHTDSAPYSISISWEPVEHATEYNVQYREEGVGRWSDFEITSATSWTKSEGIQLNKIYEVILFAVANVDEERHYLSEYTQPVTVDTHVQSQKLSVPTITVTPDVYKATVSWDAVQNASGYALSYKKTNDPDIASNWTDVSNIATTSFTVDGLVGATQYDFKVVAKGDGVFYTDSDPSVVKTATVMAKLNPVPAISVTPGVNQATASWAAVPNASGYTLYYKKSSASNWSKKSGIAASATSVTVTGLAGATNYDFKLVANGDGTSYADSDESDVVTETIKIKIGPISPYVTPGVNSAIVGWDADQNATGYTLSYKKSSASSWSPLSISASSTSVTVTGLDGATEYDFRLVARGDGTTYADSDPSAAVTVIVKAKLDTPTLSVAPGLYEGTVSWNAVDHASGYALYYKKSSESTWTTESDNISASTTSYTVDDLDGATNYDFKLVAKGDGTWRDDSNESAVKTATVKAKLNPAPTISVAPGVYKATVSWNSVSNASSYTVYWKKTSDPDSSWVRQDNISSSATSYTVANLNGATSYDFKVVANGDGTRYVDSDASSSVTKIVKGQLPTPTGLTVTGHTDKTISVKWNAVANASGYTLQCVGGGTTLTRGVSGVAYTFTDLKPATEYTISVMANGDPEYYVGSNYSAAINPLPKTKETASVVVNSTADTVDDHDGVITLREALTTYGAQGSTVTFASNMAGQTINLNAQIALSSSKTIDASSLSSPVTISGQQKTRVFALSGTNQTFAFTKVNFTQGKITSGGGGAINLTGSGAKLVVNNCAFTNNVEAGPANTGDNFANQGGGAIYVGSGARIEATNCSFTSNSTTQSEGHRGGAIHLYGGVGVFSACSFQSNKGFYGGALHYTAGAKGTMTNCLVVKNDASQRGGGAAIDKDAEVTFTNCTIAKNTATQSGGGVYVWNNSSKATFNNCIVVLNSGTSQSGHNNIGWNATMVSAPNVYGFRTLSRYVTWKSGSGNNIEFDGVGANLFVVPEGDWHIRQNSQAHDAGNNNKYSGPSTDLEGKTRIYNGTIDLGCYERPTASSALLDDAELFEESEIEDSLDLIAASLLDLE